MASLRRTLGLALALPALAACADRPTPTAPAGDRSLGSTETSEADLALHPFAHGMRFYAAGRDAHDILRRGCDSPESHQFDFWIGKWTIGPAGGPPVAQSEIDSELDGCMIEEHWTPGNGNATAGRSLNSFNTATGKWEQTWVAEGARPLRESGGFANGRMSMAGSRFHWYFGVTYFDTLGWTPIDHDHVDQYNALQIPAFGVHSFGTLHYTRTQTLPGFVSPGTNICSAEAGFPESRAFDFALGNWRSEGAFGAPLGRMQVESAVSGCALVEKFTGLFGYEAKSYTYLDPIVLAWFRTYIDNEGNRIEMRGDLPDTEGKLVLTSTEPLPGAPNTTARVTWESVSPTRIRQRWELSTDGGTTWHNAGGVTLIKQ
jgi:hypothetical protein